MSTGRRLFNVRIFTVAALSFAGGIVCALALAYSGADMVYALIPFGAALAAFALCVAAGGFRPCAIAWLVAALFFLAGALSAYLYYFGFCAADVQEGVLARLDGVAEEVGNTASGGVYIVLRGASFGGVRLGGKVIVYLGDQAGDYCAEGYRVSVVTSLFKESFFSDGEVSYRAVSGIKYRCSVAEGLDADYAFSLTAALRGAMRSALYENMDSNSAAVAYAMLTGDSSGIADATLSSFRYGGIAHVFAVSGLHIGVIYGALTVALKRVRRGISVPLRIGVLIFYSAVCSFTPSSVRATVMCAVSAVLSLADRRYDSLSGASIAALLLLLINPVYLFDKGFILSFSAICGIICLKYPVRRLLRFAPAKLADALSVSLSAQAGCFAGLMTSFGYVSAAGLLLNVVVLPLLSAYYVVIFAVTLICCALPFVGGALYVVGVPFSAFVNLFTAAGFEGALLKDWNASLTYAAFALLFAGATDKLNLHILVRSLVCIAAATLAALAILLPLVHTGTQVTLSAGYEGGVITVSTPQGSVLVFTQDYYGRSDGAQNCDVAVFVGDQSDLSAYFNVGISPSLLYVDQGSPFSGEIANTCVISSSRFTFGGVRFTYTDYGIEVCAEGVTVALVSGSAVGAELPQGADIALICPAQGEAYVLTAEGGDYSPSLSGALTFSLSDGQYALANTFLKG